MQSLLLFISISINVRTVKSRDAYKPIEYVQLCMCLCLCLSLWFHSYQSLWLLRWLLLLLLVVVEVLFCLSSSYGMFALHSQSIHNTQMVSNCAHNFWYWKWFAVHTSQKPNEMVSAAKKKNGARANNKIKKMENVIAGISDDHDSISYSQIKAFIFETKWPNQLYPFS